MGLVWGLVRGNSAGWGSLEVTATLGVGGVLALAFIVWERRAPAPMVPMHFFGARAFAAGNAAAFFFTAGLYGTLFFMAQFLQAVEGYGPLGAGLRLLPWTATLFVVAPLAGAMVNRVGERALVVAGLICQAIGLAWLAAIAAPGVPYGQLVAAAGPGGRRRSPWPCRPRRTRSWARCRRAEIGKASGTYNMLRFLGGAFGVAVLVAVFAGAGGLGSAQAFGHGFAAAIGGAACLSVLGAVAGLRLPGRRVPALVPAGQTG